MYKYLNKSSNLSKVGKLIKDGEIVIFPTDTVYAIGTNGLDSKAVKRLYDIKKRDYKNPINLLVSSIEMIETIAENISDLEYKLMEEFFPGPFTIILNKKQIIPDIVTANSNKVGVRIPDNKIALEIINQAMVPIAAPSANISGKPSGTNFNDIKLDFLKDAYYIIDDGESEIGLESTIVEVIDDTIHILRPGTITSEEISKISSNVIKDYEQKSNLIPSQDIAHYIPNCKCILVYGKDNEKMIDKVNEIASNCTKPVILSTTENIKRYNIENIIDIGSKLNLEEISKQIFKVLRKADTIKADILIIEGVEEKGIGIAIMDRLKKACQGNYVEIK